MEFDLHTLDLQDIIYGLITIDSSVSDKEDERVAKLINLFVGLSTMTNRNNNYTLHFSVTMKTAN